ncbi:hypothetical protein HAX54_010348 [Datura stramonium]|uniref:Uncharacterized protein n=1 Tax=Datura stramonium TaxID=4076 RepID=A0ABS8RWM6_DATST|nr:hypothetical protein [Datura stramonium]
MAPSAFIIPYSQYMEAPEINHEVETAFNMQLKASSQTASEEDAQSDYWSDVQGNCVIKIPLGPGALGNRNNQKKKEVLKYGSALGRSVILPRFKGDLQAMVRKMLIRPKGADYLDDQSF